MRRTLVTSLSSRNKTQEEEEEEEEGEYTNGDQDRIIMNHYNNYTCSFCRREFRSAQALGGHMNVHRRDRAKLRQIPSWLFESHHHIHIPNPNPNPNLSSCFTSTTTQPHLEPSITNQRSKRTPFSSARLGLLDSTSSYVGLFVEKEKNKSNVCSREVKKSAMNVGDEVMGLELGMSLKSTKQVLDLELRLGYL